MAEKKTSKKKNSNTNNKKTEKTAKTSKTTKSSSTAKNSKTSKATKSSGTSKTGKKATKPANTADKTKEPKDLKDQEPVKVNYGRKDKVSFQYVDVANDQPADLSGDLIPEKSYEKQNKKSADSKVNKVGNVSKDHKAEKVTKERPAEKVLKERKDDIVSKEVKEVKADIVSKADKVSNEVKKEVKEVKKDVNVVKADIVYKVSKDREKRKERKARKVKKMKPKVTGFRRFLRIALALFLVVFAIIAGYVIYVVANTEPITTESIYSHVQMSSILYDTNGKEIDRLHYEEDRERVSIDEINDNTKNAFIAIEDKTFYRHHGVNWTRIIGAVLYRLLGKEDQISGTSTITQQLARNVFLSDVKSQRTISRKLREIIYAYQIEFALTKDEILEAYLNTIYLGYGCYGLDSAANTYFSKDVKTLGLAESAALAALPQAPDTYALIKDKKNRSDKALTYLKKYEVYANDISKDRRDLVLDLMIQQGYITESQAAKARVDIKDILRPTLDDVEKAGAYTYISDFVSQQVAEDLAKEYKMTTEEADRLVHTGGLYIYSTVDPEIQEIVNTEFENDYNFPSSVEEPQAAMVITDVRTGAVLAMAGGRNTTGRKLFNRATSPRQPGSSVKPLAVYSAALQKSYEYAERGQTFPFINYGIDRQGVTGWGDYITAGSRVTDERLIIDGKIWPYNFSKTFSGYKTFRTALQQSINTCAVKIQLQVGADYSMKMLKKYGISTVVDDESKPVNDLNPAALALGAMTYGCTPLDMALAYGTFPNGGVRNSAMAYKKVIDADGNVLLSKDVEKTKVLDEGVAWIMTDVLKSVVSRGIAGNARIYGVEVGGKTGTTNDTADIWFCGFTPEYSAALWIGTDKNTQMYAASSQAAALWAKIMRQIPDIYDGEYRPMPSNVVRYYYEYYTEGTEPGAAYRRNNGY